MVSPACYPRLQDLEFAFCEDKVDNFLYVCRYLDRQPNKLVSKKADIIRHIATQYNINDEMLLKKLRYQIREILNRLEAKKIVSIKEVGNGDQPQHQVKLEPQAFANFVVEVTGLERADKDRSYEDAQMVLNFFREYNIVPDVEKIEDRIKFVVQYCWKDTIKPAKITLDCLKAKGYSTLYPKVLVAIGAALIHAGRAVFKGDRRTETACKAFLVSLKKPTKKPIAFTPVQKKRQRAYESISKKISDFNYAIQFIATTLRLNPGSLFEKYLHLDDRIKKSIRAIVQYWTNEGKVMGSASTKKHFHQAGFDNIEQSILYCRASLVRTAMYCKGKKFQYIQGKEQAEKRYAELIKDGFIVRQQNITRTPKVEVEKAEITSEVEKTEVKIIETEIPLPHPFNKVNQALPDSEYVCEVARYLTDDELPSSLFKTLELNIVKILDFWSELGKKYSKKYFFELTENTKLGVHNSVLSMIKWVLFFRYPYDVEFATKMGKGRAKNKLSKVLSGTAKFFGKRRDLGIKRGLRKEKEEITTIEEITVPQNNLPSKTIPQMGQMGWVCPLCGRSVAPHQTHCDCVRKSKS